jgi:hypothetical protein
MTEISINKEILERLHVVLEDSKDDLYELLNQCMDGAGIKNRALARIYEGEIKEIDSLIGYLEINCGISD